MPAATTCHPEIVHARGHDKAPMVSLGREYYLAGHLMTDVLSLLIN
jgi:hypothetical protein